MRLRKYEIRMSVSKNLYEHISQEAKYRDTTMANIAREKLAKHFFRNEISTSRPVESDTSQEIQSNKTLQKQFTQLEKKLELTQKHIDLVITMLDRFYFDLMKFFPNIPDKLNLAANSIAYQRHAEWLKEIEKIIRL